VIGDFLDAVVGDVRDDDARVGGRLDVDDVQTDAVSGDDSAATELRDGVGVDRRVLLQESVGVTRELAQVAPGAVLQADDLGPDGLENLLLDRDVRIVVVGDVDPEAGIRHRRLAYSTLFGRDDVKNSIDFLHIEGDVLSDVVGPWFKVLFWAVGTFSLFAAAVGIVDYTSSLGADILKSTYLQNRSISESRIYYIAVFASRTGAPTAPWHWA
jgi:hypothetical protein